MHSSAKLPVMLPMRLRNQSGVDSLRAQENYAPFRSTPFTSCSDDGADRGPGALFHDDWNSMATRAQRKHVSLYKKDRDVNPTLPAAVDTIYTANQAHDLAPQLKKKGNVATTLRSPTPRFASLGEGALVGSTRGPGEYSPERFTGAFPLLAERITPAIVREEKCRALHKFQRSFAIAPPSCLSPRPGDAAQLSSPGKLMSRLQVCSPRPESTSSTEGQSTKNEWQGLHSAPLKPALTPKNVYSHRANRELILHQRTKS